MARSDVSSPICNLERATWLLLLGSGFLGGLSFFSARDSLLALLALGPLLIALWPDRRAQHCARTRLLTAGALMISAIPLLYLLKLPIDIIAQLPGRATLLQPAMEELGPGLWLTISLAAEDTWQAWLKLLPGLAIFLAVVNLPEAARRRLLTLVAVLVLLQALWGLLQMSGGSQDALHLYASDEAYRASAAFANRSHCAAFLLLGLPLFATLTYSGGWGISSGAGPRLVGVLGAVLIVLAILATRSRAGAFLLLVEIFLLGGWLLLQRQSTRWLLGSAIAMLVIAASILPFAHNSLLSGFEFGSVGSRWELFQRAFDAASRFFPVGAGPGTFASIFSSFDTLDVLDKMYINRAHNDVIELMFEIGALGLVLYFAAVAFVMAALARYARAPATSIDAIRWICALGLFVILLHGLVDYPTRVPSIAVLALLFLGQVMAVPSQKHRRSVRSQIPPAR